MVGKGAKKNRRPARKRSPGKSSKLGATIKDQSGQGKIRIGAILSKEGQITSIQLDESKKIQQKTQERLSSILLARGYIDPDTITSVLSRLYNFDALKYSDIKPDPGILKTVTYDIAKKDMAFPVATEGKGDELTIVIAMSEPTDTEAVESLESDIGQSIRVCVSSENDIIQACRDFYKISFFHFKFIKQLFKVFV